MKKLLTVLLVSMLLIPSVFAAEPISESTLTVNLGIGTSTGEGEGSSDDAGQKVVVGFTNAEVTNTEEDITKTITPADSIDLTIDTSDATASDNTLYAFWQILSGKALKVAISAAGPLESGNNTLGWTVYKDGTETELVKASDSYAGTTIYTHMQESQIMGNAGSIKLNIVTDYYGSVAPGEYTGYLYLSVYNPE